MFPCSCIIHTCFNIIIYAHIPVHIHISKHISAHKSTAIPPLSGPPIFTRVLMPWTNCMLHDYPEAKKFPLPRWYTSPHRDQHVITNPMHLVYVPSCLVPSRLWASGGVLVHAFGVLYNVSCCSGGGRVATWSAIVGFVVMMTLDVGLG